MQNIENTIRKKLPTERPILTTLHPNAMKLNIFVLNFFVQRQKGKQPIINLYIKKFIEDIY